MFVRAVVLARVDADALRPLRCGLWPALAGRPKRRILRLGRHTPSWRAPLRGPNCSAGLPFAEAAYGVVADPRVNTLRLHFLGLAARFGGAGPAVIVAPLLRMFRARGLAIEWWFWSGTAFVKR